MRRSTSSNILVFDHSLTDFNLLFFDTDNDVLISCLFFQRNFVVKIGIEESDEFLLRWPVGKKLITLEPGLRSIKPITSDFVSRYSVASFNAKASGSIFERNIPKAAIISDQLI